MTEKNDSLAKREAEAFAQLAAAFTLAMEVGLERSRLLVPGFDRHVLAAAQLGWQVRMVIQPGRRFHSIVAEMVGVDSDGDEAALTLLNYSTPGNDRSDQIPVCSVDTNAVRH